MDFRSDPSIPVAIIDRQEVLREGLRSALSHYPDVDLVWDASAETASTFIAERRPAVLVLDPFAIRAGDMATCLPAPGVHDIELLAYTDGATAQNLREALELGVRAYVLKSDPPDLLASAIRSAFAQAYFITPSMSGCVREALLGDPSDTVTDREREILQLVAEGHTNKNIAKLFGLSPRTVEVHRQSLMRKLGAHTGAELIRRAIRKGILQA